MSGRGRGSRPKKVPLPAKMKRDSIINDDLQLQMSQLVAKLQTAKRLDDACSLLGLCSVCGQQLKENPELFKQLFLDIYQMLENAAEVPMRVVLLNLVELLASGGQLSPLALQYYRRKIMLPQSCEEAFNAALKLGRSILESVNERSPVGDTHVKSTLEGSENELSQDDLEEQPPSHASSSRPLSPKQPSAKQTRVNINNNLMEEDNLADVFDTCISSALRNGPCLPCAAQPTEKLVKAEKEEGSRDASLSQVLPSPTLFELQSKSHKGKEDKEDNAQNGALVSGVESQHELNSAKSNQSLTADEVPTKKYRRVVKVRGDVTINLDSDSQDHLEEVYGVLYLHFKSSLEDVECTVQVSNNSCSRTTTYSREFLLERSASPQSVQFPTNWEEIVSKYPEICKQEKRFFRAGEHQLPRGWNVKLSGNMQAIQRSTSLPYPGGDNWNGAESSELRE